MEEERVVGSVPEIEAETDSIKCKGCGSNMVFSPEEQKLKCNYCGSEEDFAQSSAVEELPIGDTLEEDAGWSDASLSFRCENCGARVVAENAQTACFCPFCGTSHVVAEESLQGIKPSAVVPFAFGKSRLAEIFRAWAKRKLFAPNAFKKGVKEDNVRGVYLPYFTFDSCTESVYEGRVGYVRTRVIRTKNGTRTQTYTEWRHVHGTISRDFDDVTVNAGGDHGGYANKVLPFDWSGIRVFETEYLSGFIAHRYERGIRDCWEQAKADMTDTLKREIARRHHADVVGYINVNTRHSGVTYKYVLLPVYVLNYSYKGKKYVIYTNGSTGRMEGKSPVSGIKVAIAAVLGAVLAVGFTALVYMLMGS